MLFSISFFFFNDPPTTEIYTLSLHDALPIWPTISISRQAKFRATPNASALPTASFPAKRPAYDSAGFFRDSQRSEEHTSELQSHSDLVCRLLLEKKKQNTLTSKLHSNCILFQ